MEFEIIKKIWKNVAHTPHQMLLALTLTISKNELSP
jgi:hypothetical protein